MKNGNNDETPLVAVRPGDTLTLKRFRFRVLSSQRESGLVTLELDDAPEQPLTLIGVPSMAVNIECRNDSHARGSRRPVNPFTEGAVLRCPVRTVHAEQWGRNLSSA